MEAMGRAGGAPRVETDRRTYYREIGSVSLFSVPEVEKRNNGLTEDQLIDDLQRRIVGETAEWSKAGNALATLADGLDKLGKTLRFIDPALAEKDWDFSLEDKQIVIRGADLTDREKQLVGTFLNAMPGMRDAAVAMEDASVNVSDVNGRSTIVADRTNAFAGRSGVNYYKNVAAQLDGQVHFKQLLQDTARFVTNNGKGWSDDEIEWGRVAVSVMERYLTPSEPTPSYSISQPSGASSSKD